MTLFIISVAVALLYVGLSIRNGLRDLCEVIELEGDAVYTKLDEISEALQWSNDNPRARE